MSFNAAELPPCILVVEDEPMVARVLEAQLQGAGFTVEVAPDGRRALARYEELGGAVDLIISDVNMPHMCGPELIDELRRDRPSLPVLFISGHAQHDDLPASLKRYELLPKPFRRGQLLASIRGLLRRTPPASA